MPATQPGEKTCPFIFIDQLLKERQITSRALPEASRSAMHNQKREKNPTDPSEAAGSHRGLEKVPRGEETQSRPLLWCWAGSPALTGLAEKETIAFPW